MRQAAVDLVVFDLAGVVCRFDAEHRLAVLGEAAGVAPEVVQERIWDAGIDAAGDRGELSAEEMRDAIREALGLAVDDVQLRALYISSFEPDPAVLAVVDRVRMHLPTALLTNNGPLVLEAMDHELAEVGRRFDPWGFACRYGVEKPDPAVFRAVCDEARVTPEAVFFVDDTQSTLPRGRSSGSEATTSPMPIDWPTRCSDSRTQSRGVASSSSEANTAQLAARRQSWRSTPAWVDAADSAAASELAGASRCRPSAT